MERHHKAARAAAADETDRQSARRTGSAAAETPLQNDDSFTDLRPPSITSLPTGSWESGEGGGGSSSNKKMLRARADRRKIIDTTTPTLIDEHDLSEDEEEEMVSYARERMRREMMGEASSSSRTPGGAMMDTASMRRTPGAIAMQASSRHTSVSTTEVTDAALLGFGLTLTTPVAASNKQGGAAAGQQLSADSFSSSSSSSQTALTRKDGDDSAAGAAGPPLAVNTNVRSHDPRDRSYTPAGWTLSKNPHLEVSHGAFSPNTLRLTEDLDNLLLDDEDTSGDKPRQHVFRDPVKGSFSIQASVSAIEEADEGAEPVESWTAPYIFGQDGGQAENVKSSKGKHRKGKSEGGRRSRGGDTPKTRGDSSDLAHAHPKPLRQGQGTKIGSGFATTSGGLGTRNAPPNLYEGRVDEDDGRQPLNFGGAFVPPSKASSGNFRRPVPSTLRSSSHDEPVGGAAGRSTGISQMTSSQAYGGGFRPAVSPFQAMNQSPYATPQFSVGSGSMRYPSHSPQPVYGNTTPQVNYGNAGYGASVGHGYSVGLQGGLNPYASPMGQPMGHGNMGGQPPGPPQQWSQQLMPMNYSSGMAPRDSWQGGNANRGWGNSGDFGYGQPPPGMIDSRVHLTPSPQFAPGWQDHGYGRSEGMQYPSQQMNPQGFGGGSQGFSGGYSGAPAAQGNEGRSGRDAKTKSDGRDDRGGSRKQRGGDKKKNAAKDKSKGAEAERKKRPGSPKKKKNKNRVPSPSKASASYARKDSQGGEGNTSFSEDLVDSKRTDLDEDPVARAAFKDFYRQFREKERRSFKEGEEFAKRTLAENTLPEIVRWRVHLELADLAKRSNRIAEARQLYKRVCELQPYASQGWLEYSKLEEECGHLNRCARILKSGLEYCEYSESLLTRAIKHSEKMGNLDMARQLLARLKHVGIEKVWRSVLEGALLEARAGNTLMARRVLKYLMHHVPWYGPLYLEAYRVERDVGRLNEALAIVEKGLKSIPRYGPLWFGAFRLCEALDMSERAYHLPRTKALLQRATNNISRELVWKIHLDAAQMFERTANRLCDGNDELTLDNELNVCRKRYAMTASTCPPNLSWKVWLASGRMELTAGNTEKARALFLRAQRVVPAKGRSITLLECARLEEFVGNVEIARALLSRSRFAATSDWKIWLESVLLEVRSGYPLRAIDLARRALVNHSGTGRLWACLVQLRNYDGGEEAQFSSLRRALMAVPKSGEVWCEGGRIHLNPFSNTFDLTEARRHLFFATRFTPQYGDSFLETMKLEILEQWIAPVALNLWQVLQPAFLKRLADDDAGDSDTILANVVQTAVRIVLDSLSTDQDSPAGDKEETDAFSRLQASLGRALAADAAMSALDNSVLELRCSNAGPNYGLLWFHSRTDGPIDTARTVIGRGREKMIGEIASSVHVYIGAMVRRYAIITTLRHQNHLELPTTSGNKNTEVIGTDGLEELEALLDSRLRAAPSLENMLQPGEQIDGTVLLESSVSASDFVTGYVELNKFRPIETLSFRARRRALFGSDALFS